MDKALPDSRISEIEQALEHFASGKVQFINLRTRSAATLQFAQVDMQVPGHWTVEQAHQLADDAELAMQQEGSAIVPPALLDEVTALVERPNVLTCQFEKAFLDVPQECLILTMKANQKYFPLLDAAGKLTNKFLVVSNISPEDTSFVTGGNERVVRPRLADAKFFFDQDRKKTLASRVEDRFGNWVNYTWSGDKLQTISSSDGRQISLTYSGNRIASVTSVLGTWTYAYTNNQLTSVTQPDGSQWRYNKVGKLRLISAPSLVLEGWDAECEVPEEPSSDPITYTVTHPSGAVGEFKLGVLRQTRHYVPRYCVRETTTYRYLVIPNVTDSYGLFQKKITGPGLPAMTWTYNYMGGNELAFADICVNGGWLCDQRRTVTITGPNGTFSREEYGIGYGINEGQLLKREVGSGPTAILETTTHVYADQADADRKRRSQYRAATPPQHQPERPYQFSSHAFAHGHRHQSVLKKWYA